MVAKFKRVAIFAPHFAEYALRMGIALSDHTEVLVIANRRNVGQEIDQALKAEALNCVRLLEFDAGGRKNTALSLARILTQVIGFKPDFVIMQEQIDTLSAWVARLTSPLFPILLTVHDPAPHSGSDAQYVIDNAANRRTIRGAARGYHVHGPFCRRQLEGQIEANRPIVETAHGVILVPPPDALARPEPGRILMFGRMEAYKGLEVLIDAVERLGQLGVNFKLVLAGRGPELDRLAPRLTACSNIELLNAFLTPAQASHQFQRAAVIVTPYLNATQSGVIAAAIGNGRPVVASRTGGLADAVSDGVNGLLVTPGDPAALADALGKLLTDPDLAVRLSAGARASAAAAFDWKRIVATLLEFYGSEFVQQDLV